MAMSHAIILCENETVLIDILNKFYSASILLLTVTVLCIAIPDPELFSTVLLVFFLINMLKLTALPILNINTK